MVFQFHVRIRESVWVEDRAPWVSHTSASDFAVEDLTEYIEEWQELLNATHGTDGEQQAPRLPT